jgi:hypothetical protein
MQITGLRNDAFGAMPTAATGVGVGIAAAAPVIQTQAQGIPSHAAPSARNGASPANLVGTLLDTLV